MRPQTDIPTVTDGVAARARAEPATVVSPPPVAEQASLTSFTSAAEALHDEEIERTRWFIRMGALISLVGIATVPFVGASRWMNIVFVAALVWGIVMGAYYHRAFADPRRYTENALLGLGVFSIINAHVAIMFFGVYTMATVVLVVGIHFMARTEASRIGRYIFLTAIACYAASALPIAIGVIDDPGVFASVPPLGLWPRLLGLGYVLGMYWLAYYTALPLRQASIESIEDLQRATRLASQREALMDELRADLERALRVGSSGRYSDQVLGSYKLGIVLGRGAMGEVYEAAHVTTGEPAAVKLLRRELLTDPTHVARFLREARAAGSLDSPHIVRVIDASEEGASGPPYLVMERLRGHTLAEQLRRETRLAPSDVVDVCRDVAAGLDVSHAAGIVHRDLKPQNVFRDTACWKILDFGAAMLGGTSGTLTQGGIIGTPNYMAPEQAQGKRVDGRADLYALAALAYRCFTGRHPFAAPDTPSLLYAVVHRMPIRPSELAEIAGDIDRWIAIGLAKDADERFASGRELVGALAQAVDDQLDGRLRKRADAILRRRSWEAVS